MPNRIGGFIIFVLDLDEATNFYTKKLGFRIHTSHNMRDHFEWNTIYLPDQPSVEICLLLASSDEEKALVTKKTSNTVCDFFLMVDDCQKMYRELKKKGIKFYSEPIKEPWGLSAKFYDLYGNIIDIVQSV